jgi:hypothetical protein
LEKVVLPRRGIQEIGEPKFALVETARAHRAYRRRVRREIRRTSGRWVSATVIGALVAAVLVGTGAPGEVVWTCGLGAVLVTSFSMLGPILFSDSPLISTDAWSRASQDLVSALRAGLSDSWTVLWDRHVEGGAIVTVCVGPAGVWILWTVPPGFDSGVLATAAKSLTSVVPGVAVRWEWRQPWSSASWRQVVCQMETAPTVLSGGDCRRVVRQLMVPIATERLWSLRGGLRL